MSFAEHSCVTVACDDCGNGSAEEGPIHFTSRDFALSYLREYDWMITDGRVLCPESAEKADCEATGHQLGKWEDQTWEGIAFQRRDCRHCSLVEYNPPFEQLSDLLHVARTINGLTEESR